jgi:hypothetical protein
MIIRALTPEAIIGIIIEKGKNLLQKRDDVSLANITRMLAIKELIVIDELLNAIKKADDQAMEDKKLSNV